MSFNRNIFGNNSKDEILTLVKSKEFKDIFLKHNIRNVIIFGSLTKDEFNEEKGKYVDLLRQRCEVFKKEADECGLTYYPYKEGFFVTLKVEDDDLLTRFHEAMLAQDIYTIKVNKGIRVALCSLSVEKCQGLAFKMKEILDSLK